MCSKPYTPAVFIIKDPQAVVKQRPSLHKKPYHAPLLLTLNSPIETGGTTNQPENTNGVWQNALS